MATATDYDRLRRDVGATSAILDDTEAEAFFVEAMETYSDAAGIAAYARILAIRALLASSAKLTSYKQNESSENASDVFKHLKQLLALWQDELAQAERSAGSGSARFGATKRMPRQDSARIKRYPG